MNAPGLEVDALETLGLLGLDGLDLRTPELTLWTLCLIHGVAVSLGGYRSPKLRKIVPKDRFWLFRDNRRYVGSCAWICEQLGVDRGRLISHVFRNRHTFKKDPRRLRVIVND